MLLHVGVLLNKDFLLRVQVYIYICHLKFSYPRSLSSLFSFLYEPEVRAVTLVKVLLMEFFWPIFSGKIKKLFYFNAVYLDF